MRDCRRGDNRADWIRHGDPEKVDMLTVEQVKAGVSGIGEAVTALKDQIR